MSKKKKIEGWPYYVSTEGEVSNLKGHVLSPTIWSGYFVVRLYHMKDLKTFNVHTLMLTTFVGPRPKDHMCRHLDGNPLNNDLGNLKWGTNWENCQDTIRHGRTTAHEKNPKAKLCWSEVFEIRRLHSSGARQNAIARRFEVSQATISRVVNKAEKGGWGGN